MVAVVMKVEATVGGWAWVQAWERAWISYYSFLAGT